MSKHNETLNNFRGAAGMFNSLSGLCFVESPIYSIFLYQSEENRTNPSYNILTCVSQPSTHLLWKNQDIQADVLYMLLFSCYWGVQLLRLGVSEMSLRVLQYDIYSSLSKYLFVNVKLAYFIYFNLIIVIHQKRHKRQ